MKPKPPAAQAGAPGTETPVTTVGETVTEVPVLPTARDTGPPTVRLIGVPTEPAPDDVLTFKGTATDPDGVVVTLAYSLDGGRTWHPVTKVAGLGTSSARFAVTTFPLPDGTYEVVARARDAAGHEGRSTPALVTVDRLPPTLGGASFSLEGRNVVVASGRVATTVGLPLRLTVSLAGGVTEAAATLGEEVIPLVPLLGTQLWSAEIRSSKVGERDLRLRAEDGAGRVLEELLATLDVRPPLRVTRAANDTPIADLAVRAERFEETTGRWVTVVSRATEEDGALPMSLTPGRWRLVVGTAQWSRVTTVPFTLAQTTPLSGTITVPRRAARAVVAVPVRDQGTVALTEPEEEATSVALSLRDVQGVPKSLADWRGRIVLLSVLAPWNQDSLDALAVLDAVQRALGDPFVVSATFTQTPVADVAGLLGRGGYALTGLVDETGREVSALGVRTLPVHLVFDRRGILRARLAGFATRDALEGLLRRVAQAPPVAAQAPPTVKPEVSTEAPTVEVRNGTTVAGLAARVSREVTSAGFTPSAPRNARRQDSARTVVVDATGAKKPASLDVLRRRFGPDAVRSLPSGEAPATTDFVIMLGTDAAEGLPPPTP